MSNTAALLGNLLNTNADINYYVQQQIYWSNKYEANAAKLKKQVDYEQKWESAVDDAMDRGRTKDLVCGSVTATVGCCQSDAEDYADEKVRHRYDEELSLELADLDMEYDTMKTMYDTLLEKMRADQEAEKQATSNAAQDTGLLQS